MKKFGLLVMCVSLLSVSLFAGGGQQGGAAAASGGQDVLKILAVDTPILKEGITHSMQDVYEGRVKTPIWDKVVSDLAKANIKLEFDYVQIDAYDTRFNTMLAANQLNNYDMVQAPQNLTQIGKLGLIRQKRFYPVNDIIDNHTSAGAKKFFSTPEGKSLLGRQTFYDGKVYEISAWTAYHIGDPTKLNGGIFRNPWIRADWLETLKLPMPQNLDQLYNALKAFQDNDVNKNGAKDEVVNVGNAAETSVSKFNTGIAQLFGLVYPDYLGSVGQIDKKAVSAWYQPNVKAYIQFMQKLYNAGLLRIKGADNDQAANKIAFTSDWMSGANWLNAGVQVPAGAPGSYMTPIVFDAVPGTSALLWKEASVKFETMYYVPAGTRKAAALGRLLDYLFSDDYFTLCELGIEGYNFTRNAEGVAVKKNFADGTTPDEKWDFGVAYTTLPNYIFPTLPRIRVDYRNVNGKDLFGADNSFKTTARYLAAGKMNGYPEGYTKTIAFANDAFAGKYKVQDEINMFMAYPRTEEEAQNEAAWAPDLTTYSEELLTQLIMGQKPLDDRSWSGYMADLKRLHLDDILANYQARIDLAK